MKDRKGEFTENVKAIAFAVLVFVLVRIFLFQPFTIPSPSMEPLLRAGDYIFVTKFDYGISRFSIPFNPPLFRGRLFFSEPKRGDVVVFKLPSDTKKDYIKRLIGLPGDRVQVHEGILYLNDVAVPTEDIGWTKDQSEWPAAVNQLRETLPDGPSYITYDGGYQMGDDTDVFLVPQGHYFFMGDNRDNSLDSRWPKERGVGFVPSQNLVGKARLILLSWRPGVSIFKPWTWVSHAEIDRFFSKIS